MIAVSGARTASLSYDPLGRLFETSNAPLGGGGNITRYQYDGDALVAEYGAGHNLLRRYMVGPSADEVILWDEGDRMDCSGTRFLHTNHQGSVTALANCWGAPTAINAYDEYGIPASSNVGRFQYSEPEPCRGHGEVSQAWLAEVGLYYYKARTYSPTLGRFLQTDPIGYGDGLNWYNYVGGDPVNNVDPTGLADCEVSVGRITYMFRTSGSSCNVSSSALADAISAYEANTISVVANVSTGGNDFGFLRSRGGGSPGAGAGIGNSGGGGRGGPAPTPPVCNGRESTLTSIAEIADSLGDLADSVAIGSAALGLITAPTGGGGLVFGATAAVAAGVGRVASVVSITANFADGNVDRAAAGFVGLLGGRVAGGITDKVATRVFARNRMFGDLSAGQQSRVGLLSNTAAAAGSRVASRTLCR